MASDLLRLVAEGNVREVHRILDEAPELVHATAPHPYWGGRPQALHVAIEMDRLEAFHLLLERGADVNGNNEEYDHWSPLMLAIQRGREAMRKELLRRGARIGLAEALLMGDDVAVALRLQHDGGALPSPVPNGGSWLNFARTVTAIDLLLQAGASPVAEDRRGATPVAALSKLEGIGRELVRRLAAHGVAVTAEDYARMGDREALESLGNSEAVFVAAVEHRHPELVRWLLERGANVNSRQADRSRATALHCAAWNGDLAMVEILVAAGADLAARDAEHNGTALDWAEAAIEITGNPDCHEVAAFLVRTAASGPQLS